MTTFIELEIIDEQSMSQKFGPRDLDPVIVNLNAIDTVEPWKEDDHTHCIIVTNRRRMTAKIDYLYLKDKLMGRNLK